MADRIASAPRSALGGNVLMVAGQLAVLAAFVIAWEQASKHGLLNAFYFSRPTVFWAKLVELAESGDLFHAIVHTLTIFVCGWGLAVAVGTCIGLFLGISPTAAALANPYLTFFNAFPRFLLLPFFIIWLGFGINSQITFVFVISLVFIILTVASSVRGIDRNILNNARVMGGGTLQLGRYVYLPAIALKLLSSARTTVGFAIHGALFSEFFGVGEGLGFILTESRHRLDASGVFAVILVISLIGISADFTLRVVERRAQRWME